MSAIASAARVRKLADFGVSNAASVAALEQTLGYPLDLSRSRIQERATELGAIFHKVTLPVPPTFYSLPAAHQEGFKRVGRALQLLTVPHRLQSNAYGDVFEELVMGTPAYSPLRPYYKRFAGPFNFIQPDADRRIHCFLPGLEACIRPSGGGMYPPNMTTLEDFRRFVPEGSPLDKEQRVIFRFNRAGEFEAVPYAEAFKEWLEPAAELLQGAATLFASDLPQVAGYLRSAAVAFRTNDFASNDRAWVGLTDGPLDMNIGAIEQYTDRLRGYLAQFLGVIQIKNPAKELALQPLREAFSVFEDKLPVPTAFKKPLDQRMAPPVFVVESIFATAHQNAGGHIGIAYNRPNDVAIRNKYGRRIVIMDNLIHARDFSDPAAKRLIEIGFHPSQRRFITGEALELFVFFHEMAHGNGVEHVIIDPQQDATQALGTIGRTAEELRADIVGLHNAHTAATLGLISKDQLDEIYVSYTHRCINLLRKGTEGAHARGAMVALNFLLGEKAITMNPLTGAVFVRLDQMPAAISKFAADLIQMKGRGDGAGMDRLFARFGATIPTGLDVIYKSLAAYPLDLIVDYAFETLELTA